MKALTLIVFSALLASCGDSPAGKEPTMKEPPDIAKPNGVASDNDVKTQKRSIEEAADAAAKLVEEETKAEIDALKAE